MDNKFDLKKFLAENKKGILNERPEYNYPNFDEFSQEDNGKMYVDIVNMETDVEHEPGSVVYIKNELYVITTIDKGDNLLAAKIDLEYAEKLI
jgi:hypothetical protein